MEDKLTVIPTACCINTLLLINHHSTYKQQHFNRCVFQPDHKCCNKVLPWKDVSMHLKTDTHTPNRACARKCLYQALNIHFAEKKWSDAFTEAVSMAFA